MDQLKTLAKSLILSASKLASEAEEETCNVTADQPEKLSPSTDPSASSSSSKAEVENSDIEACPESAEPSASGCAPASEAGGKNPLRVFVALLTVRVFKKCNLLKNRSQEESLTHIRRLVDKTIEGLDDNDSYCLNDRANQKICKAVLKDLSQKLSGRQLLPTMILLQEPSVEQIIVKSLQAHVKDSVQFGEEDRPIHFWKDFLRAIVIGAGILAAIILLMWLVI